MAKPQVQPTPKSHVQPRLTHVTSEDIEDAKDVTRFESDLINRRVTWLLGSQTLLFAGIGAAAAGNNPDVLRLIFVVGCSLGFVSSLGLSLGIGSAVYEIHRAFKVLEAYVPDPQLRRRETTLIHRRLVSPVTMFLGEGSALLMPITFATAWGVLLFRLLFVTRELKVWWDKELLLGLVLGPIVATAIVTCFVTPGLFKHLIRSKVVVRRETILRLCAGAGVALTDDDRTRIETCVDVATLDRWIDKVPRAKTASDVLA